MMINGLVMILLPFLKNFGLLVTCRCLQNLALGAFITADCRYVSIASQEDTFSDNIQNRGSRSGINIIGV